MHDSIADEVKAQRLAILNDRQREIQRTNYQRHLDQVLEVMVEGHNTARGQIVGRSSQNKTVNFAYKEMSGSSEMKAPAIGSYVNVRVTKIFPNSLVGEAVSVPVAPSATLLAHQALNARVPA
jgi:tRNA-2-methylthio-N6-dimethylallyladenosine synthase